MLAIVGAVLIALWVFGLIAFHTTNGLIHVPIALGIILLAVHLLRGRKEATYGP